MLLNSSRPAIAFIILLPVLLFSTGCFKSYSQANQANINGKSSVAKSDPASESYAVYSTLLDTITRSPEDGGPIKLIVINEQTASEVEKYFPGDNYFQNIKKNLPLEFHAALDDYEAKNKDSQKLTKSFNLKVEYTLVDRKKLRKFFSDSTLNWKGFYQKYPNSPGYISFSKVGFDKDMTHAFVYMNSSCGGLCGAENYELLTKENGVWKQTTTINISVS